MYRLKRIVVLRRNGTVMMRGDGLHRAMRAKRDSKDHGHHGPWRGLAMPMTHRWARAKSVDHASAAVYLANIEGREDLAQQYIA